MTKRFVFYFAKAGLIFTLLNYYGPSPVNEWTSYLSPYWVCILTIGPPPVLGVALLAGLPNALIYGVVGFVVALVFRKAGSVLRARRSRTSAQF